MRKPAVQVLVAIMTALYAAIPLTLDAMSIMPKAPLQIHALIGFLMFAGFMSWAVWDKQKKLNEFLKQSKPKLEILDIKDEIPFWQTNESTGSESFWLRLGVRNSGKSPATKCGGKIIEVLDSDNHHIGHDLIPLCWIATYVGYSVEQTELRPDEEKYLDVLVQKEKSPDAAYFAAPLRGNINDLEQVPNKMARLVIAVYSAESQSLAREFEITWNDDAHSYKSLRMKESTSDKEGSQT
jgi:hypothetical protein